MLLKTVVWLGLCLCLCGADRIRIINSNTDIQDNLAAQNAFKSKIRSLTLKSSIERALSNLASENSDHHKSEKKTASTNFIAPIFQAPANATDNYAESPGPTVAPQPQQPTSTTLKPVAPSAIIPSGCYRIEPCCCNETKPVPPLPPQPYVTPKPPCSGSTYPSPVPGLPPSGPQTGCSGCCGVAVSAPCYLCPCLSQCAIVPASSCPCQVDLSAEYICPHVQPQGVLLNELSEWIRQGYRLLDTLRTPPECAYIPGGVPSVPIPWPSADYNTHPIQPNPYVINYKAEQPNHFAPLNQAEQSSPNQFPFRTLRQRSFPQQTGYQRPGYVQPQPGQIPGYAQPRPGPIPGYPQPQPGPIPGYPQPHPGPIPGYVLPPSGGYPIAPASAQYPTVTTTTYRTTTTSGSAHLFSSSAVFVSLSALIATAFLIK